MGFLGNLFSEENDELLFFILVFLFIFISGKFENGFEERSADTNNGTVLFFILLFLFLFMRYGIAGDPKEEIVE
ncbi:MAG: hypothetical protein Q8920_02685 [Bacillota bacterium]|nr:hypothetical protein [Bacillota bacterium]